MTTLSPSNWRLHTDLAAAFPGPDTPLGTEAWFLLEGLTQHQRYEVRICWAATVRFPIVGLPIVSSDLIIEDFNTPDLITGLAAFSESCQISPKRQYSTSRLLEASVSPSSLLFLRVFAAADYYSENESLMHNVPPVNVDISR